MDIPDPQMPRDPFLKTRGFLGLDVAPPPPPMAEDFLTDTEFEISGMDEHDGRWRVIHRTPLADGGLRLTIERAT